MIGISYHGLKYGIRIYYKHNKSISKTCQQCPVLPGTGRHELSSKRALVTMEMGWKQRRVNVIILYGSAATVVSTD